MADRTTSNFLSNFQFPDYFTRTKQSTCITFGNTKEGERNVPENVQFPAERG